MNEKHLLVNSITLLYRASHIYHINDDFRNLVREIVGNIKLPELLIGQNGEAKTIEALRNTALMLCDDRSGVPQDGDSLLQRLRIDCGSDNELFDAFERGIAPVLNEENTKRVCINISQTLNTFVREKKVAEILNKAAYTVKFQRETITDFKNFVAEVYNQLEPYQANHLDAGDPAIVCNVNFEERQNVANVFTEVKSIGNGDGLLRTGWQGLNRMCHGGIRRGFEVVIGALQHNYKTGFSLTLFKQLALYNRPYMIDPTKKPLMIRISFEDDVTLNLQFLYRSLKENENPHQEVDFSGLSPEYLADYVCQSMQLNGYHIQMLRVDPTQWTYRDIINYCLLMESQGFEIHVLALDYLKMIPTTGCTVGPMGSDVRDLYRRMRNFCSPRKITLITPHQLSTDAKMMIREGRQEFVKELVGKGYYDGCKTIDNEVDLELFIHIERVNGDAYLTIQRGKHRIVEQTPLEDQYCVLPFRRNGGILDDINGPDTSRRRVGGGPIGSKDEIPFWDMTGT